ncbi:hypothetical protein C8T65DRAFT_551748, partial [Cerioporus squamosus]
MMEDLERLLTAKGIPFHRDGNRIRCFPHVVNIAVKHALSALTDLEDASADLPLETTAAPPIETPESIPDDPIKAARQLIAACRVSSQRRDVFRLAIIEGNRTGAFGEGVVLPVHELLRDVDTRWSSTFLMIDRLLVLYPAVKLFMQQPKQEDIRDLLLSDMQINVLVDIHDFLWLPHSVQELLSAEQTPTVAMVVPAYERLLEMLKLSALSHPQLAHAINASIQALEGYMQFTRRTRVYALAM